MQKTLDCPLGLIVPITAKGGLLAQQQVIDSVIVGENDRVFERVRKGKMFHVSTVHQRESHHLQEMGQA